MSFFCSLRIFNKYPLFLISNRSGCTLKSNNSKSDLLNSSFKFSEEIDENGVEWFRFHFNVVNYYENFTSHNDNNIIDLKNYKMICFIPAYPDLKTAVKKYSDNAIKSHIN